jgi:hypothetical protein
MLKKFKELVKVTIGGMGEIQAHVFWAHIQCKVVLFLFWNETTMSVDAEFLRPFDFQYDIWNSFVNNQ